MISLCIFDLDGTLSNTLRSLHYFCNTALTQCGFPPVDDIHKIQYMVGSGVHVLLQRLLTESLGSYTEEQYQQLLSIYNALYASDPLHLVTEYKGVRPMLQTLSESGVSLAVFSNKPDAMTKRVISALYPEIPFDVCRGQIDGFPKKPAPDGIYAILKETGCPREQCLYIGDSDVDMRTGQNAQVETIGVTWGFRTSMELIHAGAKILMDQPEELSAFVQMRNRS